MTRNVIATVLLEVVERGTMKSLGAPIERTYVFQDMGDVSYASEFDMLYYAKNRYLQEKPCASYFHGPDGKRADWCLDGVVIDKRNETMNEFRTRCDVPIK